MKKEEKTALNAFMKGLMDESAFIDSAVLPTKIGKRRKPKSPTFIRVLTLESAFKMWQKFVMPLDRKHGNSKRGNLCATVQVRPLEEK
jgi:hypothetical protein